MNPTLPEFVRINNSTYTVVYTLPKVDLYEDIYQEVGTIALKNEHGNGICHLKYILPSYKGLDNEQEAYQNIVDSKLQALIEQVKEEYPLVIKFEI